MNVAVQEFMYFYLQLETTYNGSIINSHSLIYSSEIRLVYKEYFRKLYYDYDFNIATMNQIKFIFPKSLAFIYSRRSANKKCKSQVKNNHLWDKLQI